MNDHGTEYGPEFTKENVDPAGTVAMFPGRRAAVNGNRRWPRGSWVPLGVLRPSDPPQVQQLDGAPAAPPSTPQQLVDLLVGQLPGLAQRRSQHLDVPPALPQRPLRRGL